MTRNNIALLLAVIALIATIAGVFATFGQGLGLAVVLLAIAIIVMTADRTAG